MASAAIDTKRRLSKGISVSQKVFVRSRNGTAAKIVREHYLRDDIPCSSRSCQTCEQISDASGQLIPFILSSDPFKIQNYGPHYIVIDTNIALHAIDLLENNSAFFDVIIPQIVLEEVKNRSLPIYNRLRTLNKTEDKRFYIFHNEFRYDTFENRKTGESINDRNDRAIRTVVKWYQSHLKKSNSNINIILITNDVDNKLKAKNEGIIALSLEEYIKLLPNSEDLIDSIPTTDFENDFKNRKPETSYPEYFSTSRLNGGLRNNTLYQGNISINSYNFLEGSVSTKAYPKPLLILGRKNLNRAFNGDSVIVELLPQSKWHKPSDEIIEEESLDSNDNAETEDNDSDIISEKERKLLAKEALSVQKSFVEDSSTTKIQPTAKVVGIIRRSWRLYVGQISPQSISTSSTSNSNALRSVFVILMDKTLPRIRIKTRKAQSLIGQRIVVVIDSWPSNSKYPEGHFVRSLGAIESEGAETESLLLEHDVEYRPFAKTVLDCLPKEGHDWKVPSDLELSTTNDEQLRKRRDLRDLQVCSIDPPGCQDIDDALHARLLENGNYEIGVHIADVTHFVKPNTPLDAEGASRGTSVYLVDKRIDMLPMLLGTDLCSLKPYVERFSFSVIWEMDENSNIINVDFTKSIIKSKEAFSYEEAQKRIDNLKNQDELTNGMRILLKISKKLKQKRLDNGALNLASPEVKVHMDSETADPNQIEIKKLLETNSLVEEFMLLANISVARKIYDSFPQYAMLRRHAPPPATNFELLNDQLQKRKNLSISVESSKSLADSLDRCIDPSEPFFNTLVRIMATRCMMSAEYFSSGNYGYPEFRHYGLAVDIYTHFTSPIRRYADIVAHRQLAAAISYESLDLNHRDKFKMEQVCKNINKRHRNAQFAGRASIEYYVGQVMKQNESNQEGFIIKVFSNGIVVLVPKFGVEGLIKLEQLGKSETAIFHDDSYILDFKDDNNNQRSIGLFDKIQVKVESVLDSTTGKRKTQLSLI